MCGVARGPPVGYAYVSKQYPSPFNIAASVGAMSAPRTSIAKGAAELAAYLSEP